MTTARATVLVDTYNHERFIEEALASVMEQDFPASEMEILVVDDGSTDRTPEIVRKFEPRVRLIRKANGGQASAFNAGIPEARGEIVAFLDGDDWWARNKLTRVVECFAADPTLGIVGHGIVMVRRDGRHETEILTEGFRFQANTLEGARCFRLRRSFLGTSRMAIKTELLRRIGPVPEALVIEADEYLFTLASTLSAGHVLREPLAYYRFHDANLFEMSSKDPVKMRRKKDSLTALAGSLSRVLSQYRVDSKASRAIVEIIEAEAALITLASEGGWPWETLRTEWKVYRVLFPDSSIPHRLFKCLGLLPGLALPPRTYYRCRAWIAGNALYSAARRKFLPRPSRRHAENEWSPGMHSQPEVRE